LIRVTKKKRAIAVLGEKKSLGETLERKPKGKEKKDQGGGKRYHGATQWPMMTAGNGEKERE